MQNIHWMSFLLALFCLHCYFTLFPVADSMGLGIGSDSLVCVGSCCVWQQLEKGVSLDSGVLEAGNDPVYYD